MPTRRCRRTELRITPIHTRVVAALRASGLRRKAGTPLETASVPVRAMAPDEKAISMNSDAGVQRRVPPPVNAASSSLGRDLAEVLEEGLVEAVDDECGEGEDVDVGGRGEQGAGLAHPTQVGDHHERDRRDAQDDAERAQVCEGGGDRPDAGGDRHGHGQHVVREQRRAGDKGGNLAEVLAGHDVRPAPRQVIGVDRFQR